MRHGHLRLLGQDQGYHRGVGIWVSRWLAKGIQGYKQFGDRILGMKIGFKQENSQPLVVICAYGPTSQTCQKYPKEREKFYSQLAAAVDFYPSRSLLYLAGDFNSKLGAGRVGQEVGRWGKGRRNANGYSLLNFCHQHGLVALNTLFQHHPKHITTWESSFQTENNRTVRNQVDFVLGRISQKRAVTQAKAYHVPEISTDHRMVVATISSPRKMWFSKRASRAKNIRLEELRSSSEKQEQWNSAVSAAVTEQEPSTWDEAATLLVEQGKKIMGIEQRRKRSETYFTDDPLVAKMSKDQKDLRQRIQQLKRGTVTRTIHVKVKKLTMERRRLQNNQRTRVRELATAKLYAQAAKVEAIKDDNARMFAAMNSKDLRSSGRTPLSVSSINGEMLSKPLDQAKVIAKYFEGLFNIDATPLPSFQAAPLCNPVSAREVAKAASRLKNGRSFGADGVPNELLKYCSSKPDDPMANTIAKIINAMFSKGQIIPALGQGILVPLQKPGKPKDRSQPTARDIVQLIFTKRILADLVMTKMWDVHILGIDLSRAFDTVDRAQLISVLKDVVGDNDTVRMVQALLSDTTLAVRVQALRDLRRSCPPTPVEDKRLRLPPETQYADDLDFFSTSYQHLEETHENAVKILPKWKLQANATKTERVHICWRKDRKEEVWRKAKSAGSRLGIADDIEGRIQLANLAMKSMWHMWGAKAVSLELKLKLFHVYVLPVLPYNAGTWGLTEQVASKIDRWHRRQLRRLAGYYYPNYISNSKLYKKCKASPLHNEVHRRRWTLFGHILRMPLDSPAQKALNIAFSKKLTPRRDRPLGGLLDCLVDDVKLYFHQNVQTAPYMLKWLREQAADKARWNGTFKTIDVTH
ncbi:uncharacterized protein LOC144912958 [Branchiostoma floridae x Branchiostoma belcheri]